MDLKNPCDNPTLHSFPVVEGMNPRGPYELWHAFKIGTVGGSSPIP